MKFEFKTLKNKYLYIIIFSTLILLFLSYNYNFNNFFYDDNSYNVLKYSESFKNNYKIDYYDNSFNNIIVEKTFFLEVIIGFLNNFIPLNFLHLLFLILFSYSLYLVYIISFKITDSKTSSILALLLYSTSIVFYYSIFSFTSFVSIPLILLFFYYVITKNFNLQKILILTLLLTLLDFKSIFLIYTLTISYFIFISKSEKTDEKITELNFILILTTIFFITLTFRENLQLLGLKVLFQNLPLELFLNIVNPKNILLRLYSSSIILLLLGTFGIIISYSKKIEKSYIIIASFFTSLILVLLTQNYFYILMLGISSAILSSFSIDYYLQFINLSIFKKYKKIITFTMIILILSLNVLQTFYDLKFYEKNYSIPEERMEIYNIIKNNNNINNIGNINNDDFKIFVPLKYSFQAEYFTKKDSFIDYNFNYVDNPNVFYNYYIILLDGKSNVEVINILKKYNIKYLYFEKKPFYLKSNVIEKNCFTKLKENFYEFKC